MKNFARLHYLALAVAFAALVPAASRAQLIFTALNTTGYAGQSGSFDLNLTNVGPDLDLRGWTAAVALTNNPNFDVKLDQSVPGSNGQFFDYFVENQHFSIAMGQTIDLRTVGFNVAPGAGPRTVGIDLSFLNGFKFNSQGGYRSGPVNGSITILGPSAVPEPGPLALLIGVAIPCTAFVLRRRRS